MGKPSSTPGPSPTTCFQGAGSPLTHSMDKNSFLLQMLHTLPLTPGNTQQLEEQDHDGKEEQEPKAVAGRSQENIAKPQDREMHGLPRLLRHRAHRSRTRATRSGGPTTYRGERKRLWCASTRHAVRLPLLRPRHGGDAPLLPYHRSTPWYNEGVRKALGMTWHS